MFQVTREDHGQWMCLINDNKNFDSVKQFVSVDVGVIPDTGVSIEAGSLYDADTETRVEVVEGDNIALSCYARQGFPPSLVFVIDWMRMMHFKAKTNIFWSGESD